MTNDRKQVVAFIETAAAMIGQKYAAAWAVAAALTAGVVLPDMPLLRHTYIAFGFVLLVALWVKLRGETWASFGLIAPTKWVRYLLFGVVLAVGAIAVDGAVRSVTTPLIVKWTGANPHLDAQTFAAIKGNFALYAMIRATKLAGLVDLHIHDLRHEGISRLFEKGLTVPEVASISGHRDIRQLARYAHSNMKLVHAKLCTSAKFGNLNRREQSELVPGIKAE